MTGWLILLLVVAIVLAYSEFRRAREVKEVILMMSGGYRDSDTGIYSLSGIAGRLLPELRWVSDTGRTISLVVFHWYVTPARKGGLESSLARHTRDYESLYRLSETELLLTLIGVNELGVLHAVRRLVASVMADVGQVVADIGAVRFPADSGTLDELLGLARERARPWQEWSTAAKALPWSKSTPNLTPPPPMD